MPAKQGNSTTSPAIGVGSASGEDKAAPTSPTSDIQKGGEPGVESDSQKGAAPQEVPGSGGSLRFLPPLTVNVGVPPASGEDKGGSQSKVLLKSKVKAIVGELEKGALANSKK